MTTLTMQDYSERAFPMRLKGEQPTKFATRDDFEAHVVTYTDIRIKTYADAARGDSRLRELEIGYAGAANLAFWYCRNK